MGVGGGGASEGRDLRGGGVPGGMAWEWLVYTWAGPEEECTGLADTSHSIYSY